MRFISTVLVALAASVAAQSLPKGAACADNKDCEQQCYGGRFVPHRKEGAIHFVCATEQPRPIKQYVVGECEGSGSLGLPGNSLAQTCKFLHGHKCSDGCVIEVSSDEDIDVLRDNWDWRCESFHGRVSKVSGLMNYDTAKEVANCYV